MDETEKVRDRVLHARAELMGRYLRLEDYLDKLPDGEIIAKDCITEAELLIRYTNRLIDALRAASQAGV